MMGSPSMIMVLGLLTFVHSGVVAAFQAKMMTTSNSNHKKMIRNSSFSPSTNKSIASFPGDCSTSPTITSHSAIAKNGISRRSFAVLTGAYISAGIHPAQAVVSASSLSRKIQKFESNNNADTVNSNGAPEKHIPQISVNNDEELTVIVPHVMKEEHYIEAIWVRDTSTGEIVAAKALSVATDPSPPTLITKASKGSKLQARLYCNLHGLWEGDAFSV